MRRKSFSITIYSVIVFLLSPVFAYAACSDGDLAQCRTQAECEDQKGTWSSNQCVAYGSTPTTTTTPGTTTTTTTPSTTTTTPPTPSTTTSSSSNASILSVTASNGSLSFQTPLLSVSCIASDNNGIKRINIVLTDKNAKTVVHNSEYRAVAVTPLDCLGVVQPYEMGLAEGELKIQIQVEDGNGNIEIPNTANNLVRINWSLPLNLNITPPQNGSVVGTIGNANINCGNAHYECYASNQILTNVDFNLTAVPNAGFKFNGWTGACSQMPCKLTAHDNTLSANFIALNSSSYNLTVNQTGSGTVSAAGLTCTSSVCTGSYSANTPVTLAATPAQGFVIDSWTGCTASADKKTCQVTIDAAKTVAVTFKASSVSSVTESYVFVSKWGSQGVGDGQFYYPSDVTVDTSGNLYVVDHSNNRIQKFNANGQFVTKFGSSGLGDGQFQNPWSITTDADGNVYITDTDNSRIQKFNANGQFITKWGLKGTGDGKFQLPTGIAVDASGNVHITDGYNSDPRIQKFNASGQFITKWGSYGTGDGQLDFPYDIAADASGNVYVTDPRNSRIQKFNVNGQFIAKWGSYGTGDGQFQYLYNIALDINGNIYVVDVSYSRIQKFNANGQLVAKWGSYGTGDGQFIAPAGIAVDANGNVYVADYANHRIQKFAPTTSSTTSYNLTVNQAGSGAVSAAGLTCSTSSVCTGSYSVNTPVTLTATPAQGFVVDSWTGCTASVDKKTCQTTMDTIKTVNVVFSSSTISGINTSTGLVAYYCFDDPNNIGKDCSGNNNTGTAWGGVNATTGIKGGAANFGGTANPGHIYVPNSNSLKFDRYLSVSAFVKLNSPSGMDGWGGIASSGVHTIFAKDHDRTGLYTLLSMSNGTTSIWQGNHPALSIGGTTQNSPLQNWLHLAFVFSKDNNLSQLYLNGVLVKEETDEAVDFSVDNTRDLYLGKYSDSWYPLNGMLDEVRFYNRVLSASEIQQLANNQQAPVQYALSITKPNSSNGTITATGVTCGTTECVGNFAPNTLVTFTATPAQGFVIDSWTGCTASADKKTCQVTVDSAKTVNVLFKAASSVTTARLINLSANAKLPIIGGLGMSGTGTLRLMFRGFAIDSCVDPTIVLQKYPSGEEVARNNDWQIGGSVADSIQNLPSHLTLTNPKNAGLLIDLPVGYYTISLGSNGCNGQGLVGVDLIESASSTTAKLVNLSANAPVPIIGGLGMSGSGNMKAMFRGFQVDPCVDANLLIQKYPSGESFASNNDWGMDINSAQVAALPSYLQLPKSNDAGLLRDLTPQYFTATLSSNTTCSGNGLFGLDMVQ